MRSAGGGPSSGGASVAPSRVEVFLSHATQDREAVAVVQRQIEALGVDVYLAENDPQPGTAISAKVQAALERCHAVVVLITTNSVNSAYVQQEVGIAHVSGKPIIPVVDKAVDRSRLGMLAEVEQLDLDLSDPTEAMARMTASLQPLVMRQLTTTNVAVTISPQTDAATALILVGLGLLLGYLIFNGGLGGSA